MALVAYCVYVVHKNSIPHARKNEIGILFIFKTSTNEQFEDFKYIVEENFKNKATHTNQKIVPICIRSSTIKNYDITNEKVMVKLLYNTRCDVCIEFFVESNSLNNPTKYNTAIRTGVLHPKVSKVLTEVLMNSLSFGGRPLKKLQFDVDNKLNTLKTTADYIALLSEYIIGILLIMYNDFVNAQYILAKIFEAASENHILYPLIADALYNVSVKIGSYHMDEYTKYGKYESLLEAEKSYLLANKASANGYEYHLCMAKLVFLKDRNITIAKEHIYICKKINKNDYWKYSEAFLLAYETNNPNIIYSKYKNLKNNSYNNIEIIQFIETVLENEPDKTILHLALGVLYDNIEDKILSNCHFKQFIYHQKCEYRLRQKSFQEIKSKINKTLCMDNPDKCDCGNCPCNE